MKKVLSILLVLIMVVSLCACSGGKESAAAQPKEFRVGFGRVNLTPTYSVPLAGYGNSGQRMSQGFLSYLYATCIAVSDANDSTVLLITLDGTGMYNNVVPLLKEAITEATGVAGERIMMNVTHAHSGPDLSNTNNAAIQRLIPEYVANVAQAAKDAMADRSPATMETGVGYTENLNFVRHYTTTSGQLYSDNMTLNGTITGHHHDPDNEIQMIRFVRAAKDKKDILAVNWQAHPKLDSGGETEEGKANRPFLSADYVGAARDYIEKNTDYLFAFYLGAAGNLNANSKIFGENASTKCAEYGALLGGHIMDGLESMKAVADADMKVTLVQQQCEAVYDHTEDHKVADAAKIANIWSATNNYTEAMSAAAGTEIYSPYHAQSIINRSKITDHSKMLELNAIRIGGVAVATFPYEMFDVNAMHVKDESPFETTFIMSMCNGANSYVAAEYAYTSQGTYEVHNRQFEKGTAENMANAMVEMLGGLAG